MAEWDKLLVPRCPGDDEENNYQEAGQNRFIHVGIDATFKALTKNCMPPLCPDLDCFDLHASTAAAIAEIVFHTDFYGDRSPHTFHFYCDGSGGSAKSVLNMQ